MAPIIVRPNLGGDSGQVSAFRPAVRQKPASVLQRFANAVRGFRKAWNPDLTTQQGTPGTSSPLTAQQALWAQRFERAEMIADCNLIYLEDARIKAAVDMYVREAVRGGFQIKVDNAGHLAKKAATLAEDFTKLIPVDLQEDWGACLIKEGDLFVQLVCQDSDVVKLVAMPAASMERLSDEADEIINPEKAFEQVDTQSWTTIAPFADWAMVQVRWKHRSGNRYGTPELVASRRPWRILKLLEESTATRAMVRAPMRLHHKIGDPKNGMAGTEADIATYKANNGYVDGKREIFDPLNAALEYFSNGNAQIEPIEGDPHLDKIDFIRYMQNVLSSTLPTPLVLIGLDTESVNRDVVEDVRAEWLKSTTRLNEALEQVIRFGFDLQLMLAGIDPALVTYSIGWSTSSIERPAEEIASVIDLVRAGLMSEKTALTKLQQYSGFEDVDTEWKAIQEEQDRKREAAMAMKTAGVEPDPEDPKKRVNGKATNGHAKRLAGQQASKQ